ncbi:MAG: 3-deoxy-manno-octulosonate cytidylyltransferase (CMP-KDO synthetase) [Kiritimatiellia bacterium]
MFVTTRAIGIVPARYDSARFPGKMLVPVGGKPLVQWVVERAAQATSLDAVLLATDDERIRSAAEQWGVEAVMTRGDHPSGSDRIAEAASLYDAEIIVNIQGDEPLIDPSLINQLVECLRENPALDMATAAVPILHTGELNDPSVVKVVTGADDVALYFSRAVIPFNRDGTQEHGIDAGLYFRHLGIYAYRKAFLLRVVGTEPTLLEQTEKLEQLRALHLGARMKVIKTTGMGPGVDHPDDVPKAEAALREAGLIA